MRGVVIGVVVAGLLSLPASVGQAMTLDEREPEGCEAMNPVAPDLQFHRAGLDGWPRRGCRRVGHWIVKVKRGKKTVAVLKSPPSGEPTAVEFLYQQGDKVSVSAVSPGSSVIAGGD